MTPTDPRLRALLQAWPGPEPRPALADDTLRRIRLAAAAAEARNTRGLRRLWLWWAPLWRPLAATLAVAFALGVLCGLTLPPASVPTLPGAHSLGSFQIQQPGTVSGNYLALSGRAPG